MPNYNYGKIVKARRQKMRTEFEKVVLVTVSILCAGLVYAVDLQSETCQPASDGQSCNQITCPDSNEQCIPKNIRVNYNGQTPTYTVIECQCMDVQTDCHININPQFEVYVTGTCQAPNSRCQLIETDNGDGTIDYECNCGSIQSELVLDDFPPGQATNLAPANGATGISRTGTTLTWTAGANATDHLVYLGTVSPPPKVGNVAMPTVTYNTGALGQGKLYYWRIDANNGYGDPCAGDIWNFRVEECVKSTAPFYTAWTGAGGKPWSRPDCWCYGRNCRGDYDGLKQLGLYWVYSADLAGLKDAWGKTDAQLTDNRICADFCRDKALNLYRVYTTDFVMLKTWYANANCPVCPKDFNGDGDDDYNFWTN